MLPFDNADYDHIAQEEKKYGRNSEKCELIIALKAYPGSVFNVGFVRHQCKREV